jgi:hypothetical protein
MLHAHVHIYPLFVRWLRHCNKGIASGPTGWLNCQVPLSATSNIFAATSEGGTGFSNAAQKRVEKRGPCPYGDSVAGSPMCRAIAESMMSGSTMAMPFFLSLGIR